MTIDLKNNRIYHYGEDLTHKEHKPFSTNFKEIEVLPNGKILVIEDYYDFNHSGKSNLYCINQDLKIEWFLPFFNEHKSPIDLYVGFTTNGQKVYANTFSCFRVEIDIEQGTIKNIQFTK